MTVMVTYEHREQGYQFTQEYDCRRTFLSALSRTKHYRFISGIEFTSKRIISITPRNLEKYKNNELTN